MRVARTIALGLGAAAIATGAAPSPALATPRPGVVRTHSVICRGLGWLSGIAGTVCKAASHPKTIIDVGKKLLSGNPGGALTDVFGSSGAGRAVAAAAGLAAIVAWVTGGARSALQATAHVIATSSRPNLLSTWFSGAYWRVAAVSALLTLPFLFAAAVQALLRSDITLLVRAAFGYLPVGMLAVGVGAPMTMLLLGASDEMSGIVASASGHADGSFLAHAGIAVGAVGGAAISPFVACFVGLMTVAAAVTLWLELLIREAAVYVIVLMLPLFFAALVWPARRVWAVRAVELLVALILSKFAIVAVLSLGGAALDHAAAVSVTSLLAGLTLVLLAAFSPWAMLRLLPLHEMASAAAGGLRTSSLQPLLTSDERGSHLASTAPDQRAALEQWFQQSANHGGRDSESDPASDTVALPAASADNAETSRPVSQERVEAAAEEAAAAVAASGGGSVGTTWASSPMPTAAPGATEPRTADAEPESRLFTAPGLETLPDHWRQGKGQPVGPGMDTSRPFFDAEPPESDPGQVVPPTLPDAEPRPPAADPPGEDRHE